MSRSSETRAKTIEKIVQTEYLGDDVDAADLAYETIRSNPTWTDDQVAQYVAQLIAQP